jgi:hypothetical protein
VQATISANVPTAMEISSVGLILCRLPFPWAAAAPQYGQLRSYSRSSFPHFGQNMILPPFLRFYFTSFTVRAYHTTAILARQIQKKGSCYPKIQEPFSFY